MDSLTPIQSPSPPSEVIPVKADFRSEDKASVIDEFLSLLSPDIQKSFLSFLDTHVDITAQQIVVLSQANLESILSQGQFAPSYSNGLLLNHSSEYKIGLQKAARQLWLAACKVAFPCNPTSLFSLLQQSSISKCLVTMDSRIDSCIGNALLKKGIIDIVGEASSGKTCLALQISLNCIAPIEHGGLNKGVLWIVTEGDFPMKRWQQMHDFKISKLFSNLDDSFGPHSLNQDMMIVQKVNSLEAMEEFMFNKMRALLRIKNIGLIVIDSIAHLLRDTSNSNMLSPSRTPNKNSNMSNDPTGHNSKQLSKYGIMAKWASFLKETSDDLSIPVITLNQVSDFFEELVSSPNFVHPHSSLGRFNRHSTFITSNRRVTPALGLRWSELINSRICLKRTSIVYGGLVNLERSPFKNRYGKRDRTPEIHEPKSLHNVLHNQNHLSQSQEENYSVVDDLMPSEDSNFETPTKRFKTHDSASSEIHKYELQAPSSSSLHLPFSSSNRYVTGTPQAWNDASVVIRRIQVLFSPTGKSGQECPFVIDSEGIHSVGE